MTRLERATAIAERNEIVRSGNAWLVPSTSSELVYRVTIRDGAPHCTCADFRTRGGHCKHILSAAIVAAGERERTAKPWMCEECGRRMTLRQAERAMRKGCPRGCSGIDVHEVASDKATV